MKCAEPDCERKALDGMILCVVHVHPTRAKDPEIYARRMAREADLEREREACAKIADAMAEQRPSEDYQYRSGYRVGCKDIAAAIRARGKA